MNYFIRVDLVLIGRTRLKKFDSVWELKASEVCKHFLVSIPLVSPLSGGEYVKKLGEIQASHPKALDYSTLPPFPRFRSRN